MKCSAVGPTAMWGFLILYMIFLNHVDKRNIQEWDVFLSRNLIFTIVYIIKLSTQVPVIVNAQTLKNNQVLSGVLQYN